MIIEIIENTNLLEFEEELNNFIDENMKDIQDIKYSVAYCDGDVLHSAMIILNG